MTQQVKWLSGTLAFIALAVICIIWVGQKHVERTCLRSVVFDVDGSVLSAKGSYCAEFGPWFE